MLVLTVHKFYSRQDERVFILSVRIETQWPTIRETEKSIPLLEASSSLAWAKLLVKNRAALCHRLADVYLQFIRTIE